jgi:nitrate reductase NapAB chaperone NapD
MNISSAIVFTANKDTKELILALKAIEGCDVPMFEDQKLIVSIEAADIAAETGIMKKIENTPGVISVRLVYSYSENELAQEMKKVEEADDFPEWLNDQTGAKDIPYSGKLKM